MITHHLLDALAVLPHSAAARQHLRVLDVGTGGGVPGHSARDRATRLARSCSLDANHKKVDVPDAGRHRARAAERPRRR